MKAMVTSTPGDAYSDQSFSTRFLLASRLPGINSTRMPSGRTRDHAFEQGGHGAVHPVVIAQQHVDAARIGADDQNAFRFGR